MPRKTFGEIIPKPKPKTPGWLFYLSIILLIVSLLTPLYLKKRISGLEKEKERLEKEITELKGEEEKELEKELLVLKEKIKIFQKLFQRHKNSSKIFSLLESLCHPKVQFLKLNLDTKNSQVNLEGKTDSFQFLGEQLLVLKMGTVPGGTKNPISDLTLANIYLDREGKVRFNLTFSLAPEIFKR